MACPDRLDRALSLLLPPAFWLGVWQLGAWLVELHVEGRGNELLLPYPATVLLALFRLARSPEFWWTASDQRLLSEMRPFLKTALPAALPTIEGHLLTP